MGFFQNISTACQKKSILLREKSLFLQSIEELSSPHLHDMGCLKNSDLESSGPEKFKPPKIQTSET